ncbi:nucleotide sugar dehydrogenase [Methylobacterium oxalidis]|uniref:UDP-N-acetyl-D-glucosamine dehydrogenase n=1 Tax=Methylobacterium oxalidis TaxID=944322 RepID=A0A512J5N8_9HYPH|nr:nucleotide sugar dehydrogenase [Methylobacterium oxalidis]GEP05243.1 UDP-N-acetyl-D-glucosamine dehydrogenase [Methylobacterium oxalidis]GJE29943.1 UDP-N-acetyl-D-glucosamine 6-dehydrogenase [Methylobacterium oxalidis]GLS64713.1 UDP-N-acetyl-D-glucosamine dehydrogenase [Methylobacterium oxalidis]
MPDLTSRLRDRTAEIGVIGLGYVGLPLALAAVRAGFRVTGYDINAERVGLINEGRPVIAHLDTEGLRAALATGRFRASADMAGLSRPDAILICVPTPLTRQREPDLSYVRATARDIARTLRRGQLVVLESTTWPGTTTEIVRPILESTGLASGSDFHLAFSPEREDPGNARYGLADLPKVVGGDGEAARDLACLLYDPIVARTVPVSSAEAAEAVKLTENIFRAVNIALVNELKVVYDALGIDVWEVIGAAATKPFGFMPFEPGPGLGGHCIPIDPFYLTWKAREHDIATRFIELAGEVNRRMPHYVVERLALLVDRELGRPLGGAAILMIGMAYKRNIDDVRESPALKLMDLLEARGARVAYHDPFVEQIPPTREFPHLAGRAATALTPEIVAAADAVLVVTDHDGVDYATLVRHARIVVDTRNVCARTGNAAANVFKC